MIGILIITLLWLLYVTKSNKIRAALLLFFFLWQGIPAFNIWWANKLVDELCAKDGDIIIYETVTLPKERFNEYGQFIIHDKDYIRLGDEYFTKWETQIIKGNFDYTSLLPRVIRDHYSINRVKDGKLLAEFIAYRQGGGEAMGFALVSSGHSCPLVSDLDLAAKVFIKTNQ